MSYEVPKTGIMFWPVGTGDSSTIIFDDKEKFIQVDLRHMVSSEDKETKAMPVIDELEKILPKKDGKPFLDLFILTHPDKDHIQGFSDMKRRISIGELWFSPRVFREFKKDLCDDAVDFKKEAERRVEVAKKQKSSIKSGDRVRIIGYDDLLKEEKYKGFPKEYLSVPGNQVSKIDGEDYSDLIEIFIHSPFKDFSDGDRNDASIGIRARLKKGKSNLDILILGDLSYPPLNHLFEKNKEKENIMWNILLAPHHCSKKVMYWKDSSESEEELKKHIINSFDEHQNQTGYIISSSDVVPGKNSSGDNPPHRKAKNRYEEIVNNDFICTHEYPSEDKPQPVAFKLERSGIDLLKGDSEPESKKSSLEQGLAEARGSSQAPEIRVGYGIFHNRITK